MQSSQSFDSTTNMKDSLTSILFSTWSDAIFSSPPLQATMKRAYNEYAGEYRQIST